MQAEALLARLCGFEEDGRRVRIYFDEPLPLPSLGRQHGVRSAIFRDLSGAEADAFRLYLERHPRWSYLRVHPVGAERAAVAGLVGGSGR